MTEVFYRGCMLLEYSKENRKTYTTASAPWTLFIFEYSKENRKKNTAVAFPLVSLMNTQKRIESNHKDYAKRNRPRKEYSKENRKQSFLMLFIDLLMEYSKENRKTLSSSCILLVQIFMEYSKENRKLPSFIINIFYIFFEYSKENRKSNDYGVWPSHSSYEYSKENRKITCPGFKFWTCVFGNTQKRIESHHVKKLLGKSFFYRILKRE